MGLSRRARGVAVRGLALRYAGRKRNPGAEAQSKAGLTAQLIFVAEILTEGQDINPNRAPMLVNAARFIAGPSAKLAISDELARLLAASDEDEDSDEDNEA